ncbi:hypothetical protein P43SY_000735 [Pythium insidiosum]|uniref:Uncharacterized protein n=1 Tax=Pythium insidiosum TaxID=114742 RepID=A0AAD5LTB7_PYTIN|nr:hypothetical protein P43SY_000735 [Pythium insidiosum]
MTGTDADNAPNGLLYDGSTTESEYFDEPEDAIEGAAGVVDDATPAAVSSAERSSTATSNAVPETLVPLERAADDASEYMADVEEEDGAACEKTAVKSEAAAASPAAAEMQNAAAEAETPVALPSPTSATDKPSAIALEPTVPASATVKAEPASLTSLTSLPLPPPPPVLLPPPQRVPAPPQQAAAPSAVQVSSAPWQAPPVPAAAPRFISPFACLAVPLRPPPVVGAPPILLANVPPPAPVQTAPTSTLVRPKCLKCQGELRQDGSCNPTQANAALCHCCLRYYGHDAVQRATGSPLCSNCAHPPAAAAAAAVEPPALHAVQEPLRMPAESVAAPAAPARAASAQPPVSHLRSTPYTFVPATGDRLKCCVCSELVTIVVPKDSTAALTCKCCGFKLATTRFSMNQQSKPLHRRRCRSCANSDSDAFLPYVQKLERAKRTASVAAVKAKQKRTPPPKTTVKAKKPSAKPSDTASAAVDASAQPPPAWTNMERSLGKILMAERSIARRRAANDLRGASKLEYEAQLAKEEEALKKQATSLRKTNMWLYEKVKASLVVEDGIAPKGEQDKNLTAAGMPKPKPKPKAKAKAKTVSKKRTATAAASKKEAPPSKKPKATKTAAASRSTRSSASAAAPKPIEIIVIDDDDD